MPKLSSVIIFTLLAIASIQSIRAQEIIEIPLGIKDGKGSLYDAIMGDVTETGERAHPNATYRLARGQVYPVPEMTFDFDITIDAADGEGRPPMIIPEKSITGNIPWAIFFQKDTNSLTFKNILFNGVSIDKTLGKWAMNLKSGKVVIEDCVFNGFTLGAIGGQNAQHYNLQVNNTIFRNCQGDKRWWEGSPIMFWAALGDTLSITNCTFFNNTTIVVSNWEQHYTKYYRFCHNTVYGSGGVGQSAFAQTDSEIRDNLFINLYAMGIDTTGVDHGEGARPGQQTSIVPVSINNVDKMSKDIGVESEAERKIVVLNNVYYWSDEVLDHWASRGDQFPPASENPVFMNAETQGLFDDDVAYPLFEESGNIEANPMFVNRQMELDVIAGYAKRGNLLYDSAADGASFPFILDPFVHYYPGDFGVENAKPLIEWPLAENLTYTNELVLTASSTGGPVGDPRWYVIDSTTALNDPTHTDQALEISNYPNPFSNSTTITYQIEKPSRVSLTVFDVTGKEVAVLINEKQQAGNYNIQWKPNVSPGLYFCRIFVNNKGAYTKVAYTDN